MTAADKTKRIVIGDTDWSTENGFVIIKHNGEKMILNDSLSLVWLEIGENTSVTDICGKIRRKFGDEVTDENIENVVAESIGMLSAEGLVTLADKADDMFSMML